MNQQIISNLSFFIAILCLSLIFCGIVPAKGYNGDINGYCKEVADAGGGSYTIEKGCRDMETEAKNELNRMNIPTCIFNYCAEVADASGKSYSIMKGCVDMEIQAKKELQ